MTTKPLVELAKTIRSKNAGVDQITFDIVFRDRETYELVKRSGVIASRPSSSSIPRSRSSSRSGGSGRAEAPASATSSAPSSTPPYSIYLSLSMRAAEKARGPAAGPCACGGLELRIS